MRLRCIRLSVLDAMHGISRVEVDREEGVARGGGFYGSLCRLLILTLEMIYSSVYETIGDADGENNILEALSP